MEDFQATMSQYSPYALRPVDPRRADLSGRPSVTPDRLIHDRGRACRRLLYRELACIKRNRVLGRPQWGYGAPSVTGITVADVAENPFQIDRRIPLRQFKVTAFGTHLIGCEDEYLAVRVRADHRSDVTTVKNRSPA